MSGEKKVELFLEIGCEEIPARFIPPALADLRAGALKSLKGLRLDHGEVASCDRLGGHTRFRMRAGKMPI